MRSCIRTDKTLRTPDRIQGPFQIEKNGCDNGPPPPCTPFARTPRAPPSVLAYDYTYNTLEQSSNT
jgi:hypothetical protein